MRVNAAKVGDLSFLPSVDIEIVSFDFLHLLSGKAHSRNNGQTIFFQDFLKCFCAGKIAFGIRAFHDLRIQMFNCIGDLTRIDFVHPMHQAAGNRQDLASDFS